jgi:predicted ATPase
VAGALGVREGGEVQLPDRLKEYLSRRELLLVLDNFEQLLSAAPLAGELLSAAPRLKGKRTRLRRGEAPSVMAGGSATGARVAEPVGNAVALVEGVVESAPATAAASAA